MLPLQAIGYPLFLVFILEFVLAIILLTKRPSTPLHKATAVFSLTAAFFALCGGIVYVRASLGLDFEIFYRGCWIGWVGLPALLQIVYYMQEKKSRALRAAIYVLYPFWIVIFLLCLTTDLVETGVLSLLPYVDRTGPLEIPARLVGGTIALWIVYEIWRLRKTSIGVKREQVKYFFAGIIIYAAGAAPSSGYIQLFGGLGFDPGLGSYFSLPWVILTYYAITRHRLFDMQIILTRVLTIAVLIIASGVLHLSVIHYLEPVTGPGIAELLSLGVVIAVLFGTPLSLKVQEAVSGIVLKGKYDYQEVLKKSTKALTTILDTDELLNYIIDVIRNSFQLEELCFFLESKGGQYEVRTHWSTHPSRPSGDRLESSIVSWIEQEKSIFVKEEQEQSLPREIFSRIYGTLGDMGTELAIPIFYKGRLKGILTLGAKGNRESYVQSDIDLLEALASQAAIAIENAQLYEEAITDGLTGLYHHKYFKIRLREELERARRHKRPLGLMMIDIDDFKKINDTRGHLTGDSVLKEVATLLKASIRVEDIAARYGGDELALILPETSGEMAKYLGERLRRSIESLTLKKGISITVSIGIGYSDEHSPASDNQNLIERADNALYRAKQNGKNRMEIGS